VNKIDSLTLVWDAKAGLANDLLYIARKLAGIGHCSLCDITHSGVRERAEWVDCRDSLGVPVEVLYRDGLDDALATAAEGRFPCAIAYVNGEPRLLLTPEVIDGCGGKVQSLRSALVQHAADQGLELGLAPG